ncbi:MAG: type I restriction enzyme HsdR N-terminal domain-containing protein [Armatimonadetes bacterium]|nr:type I restriction enzyme HsdR N-terminal domain-containing protein [Armatimonadota bacterium]
MIPNPPQRRYHGNWLQPACCLSTGRCEQAPIWARAKRPHVDGAAIRSHLVCLRLCGGAMVQKPRFARGLSEEFMRDLREGALSGLLDATRTYRLDLQIREDYLNLYHDGKAVLKLEHRPRLSAYRAVIHSKFLPGVELPGPASSRKEHMCFDAGPGFVDAYASQLPKIIANACRYRHSEGAAEEALIRQSLIGSSPVVFIDRQVQVHGVSKRADVIGLTRDGERVILGEVKQGLNNDIQHLIDQLTPYYHIAAGADGCLSNEFAFAYRVVVEQKRELGVLPESIVFPAVPPRVDCLVMLCDYNEKSQLLGRLRGQAARSDLRIWLTCPFGPDYLLSPPEEWEQLCPSA